MTRYRFALTVLALLATGTAHGQTVQVNPQNRTIELTAQSSIEIEADLVSVTVGYHNYGTTHEATYNENLRVADEILKSWMDAGLATVDVSTHSLTLSRVSDDDLKNTDASERKQKQFEATQSWTVTQKVAVAQKLLDIAVAAGANEVGDPEWKLSDPDMAEGRAYASALEKAHGIAEEMAHSFGAKVGTCSTPRIRAVRSRSSAH